MVSSKCAVSLLTKSAQSHLRLTSLTKYGAAYLTRIQSLTSLQLPWAEVKKEMTEEKGLDPSVADKIGEYVKHKGGPPLLDQLLKDDALVANPSAKLGMDEMGLLFSYLEAYNVLDKVGACIFEGPSD